MNKQEEINKLMRYTPPSDELLTRMEIERRRNLIKIAKFIASKYENMTLLEAMNLFQQNIDQLKKL